MTMPHRADLAWHDLAARLLLRASGGGSPVSYLVTGCGPRAGVSTVCRRVAALAVEAGQRVGVLEIKSPEQPDGVSLAKTASPVAFHACAKTGFALWTLPESFAAMPAFAARPREWVSDVDILLIDAPPAGTFMQQHLAPLTDGVVLVVDTRRQSRGELVRAGRTVTDSGGKLLGVVLNRHQSPIPRWFDHWNDNPQ